MEIAKWMIALVAVFNFGGLFVDGLLPVTARTHLYNPNWPPHAKFHNCQTMLLGVSLGVISLILLFAVKPLTFPLLALAAAVGGVYFVAMLVIVPLFPGTDWVDPEFKNAFPKPLGLNIQQLVTYILCTVLVTAVGIAYFAS